MSVLKIDVVRPGRIGVSAKHSHCGVYVHAATTSFRSQSPSPVLPRRLLFVYEGGHADLLILCGPAGHETLVLILNPV